MAQVLHWFWVRLQREPWWAELWSGLAIAGWAVFALREGYDFVYRPIFFSLVEIEADPQVWIMIGLITGIFQIFAAFYNTFPIRWAAAFFASWLWALLVISMHIGDPKAPSIALYIVFAVVNWVSMIRLARLRH